MKNKLLTTITAVCTFLGAAGSSGSVSCSVRMQSPDGPVKMYATLESNKVSLYDKDYKSVEYIRTQYLQTEDGHVINSSKDLYN